MTAPKGLDELYKGRLVARGDITYEVTRNDGRVARLSQVSPARPMGGDLAIDADDLGTLRLLTMTAAAAGSRPARWQPGELLRCTDCGAMLPPERFREDTRCARRGRRAYACLACEARPAT